MTREEKKMHMQQNEEGLTPEDLELLQTIAEKLRRSGPEQWLILEISRKILEFEERRLRLVYFFSRNLK